MNPSNAASRDEYLQRIDSANAIDDVIRKQRVFERANEYAKSFPEQIISPRPVTVQVQRPSADFLRECDEIVARQDRRNREATEALELVTEGHVRKSDAELHE